jgi:hypothetical protein
MIGALGFLWPLGFGLWALGFGLWALGFGLWSFGFGLWSLVARKVVQTPKAKDQG